MAIYARWTIRIDSAKLVLSGRDGLNMSNEAPPRSKELSPVRGKGGGPEKSKVYHGSCGMGRDDAHDHVSTCRIMQTHHIAAASSKYT